MTKKARKTAVLAEKPRNFRFTDHSQLIETQRRVPVIVISHRTAFLFWRQFRGNIADLGRLRRNGSLGERKSADGAQRRTRYGKSRAGQSSDLPWSELSSLGIEVSDSAKIDLLFFAKEERLQSRFVRAHVTTRDLPAGSLLRLSPEVAIVSPELCYAQMSGEVTARRLTLVGTELCGTYALVGKDRLLEKRAQLTDAAKIQEYLSNFQPTGNGPAHLAAKYLLDGAASPMEAKTALLLTLPTIWGGFGLPRPELNAKITLSSEAKAFYPHFCRADLFWRSARLDIEYDGEEFHSGSFHSKDVARTAALKVEGIEVIALSAAQINDTAAFEQIARLISERLRRRFRIRRPDYQERQVILRSELGL